MIGKKGTQTVVTHEIIPNVPNHHQFTKVNWDLKNCLLRKNSRIKNLFTTQLHTKKFKYSGTSQIRPNWGSSLFGFGKVWINWIQ